MSSRRIVDLRSARSSGGRASHRPPAQNSKRRSPLRARRRRLRLVLAVSAGIVTLGLIYGLHALSYAERFTIQTIVVKGADKMPSDVVASYVRSQLDDGRWHFLSRSNIFLYHKAAIEHALAVNFPRVLSASMGRGAPLSSELIVTISERQPFALWCAQISDPVESCSIVDERGYFFADNTDLSEHTSTSYIFSGGILGAPTIGNTLAPGHLAGIVALLNLLTSAGYTPKDIAIQSDRDLFITLQQGFYIKVSYGEDGVQLVRNLQLILTSATLLHKEAELEYIDLRFGNRIYYKFKGQLESPIEQ